MLQAPCLEEKYIISSVMGPKTEVKYSAEKM